MNAQGPSNDEYETPPWLYKAYDTEFGLTFDAACRVVPMDAATGKDKPPLLLTGSNRLCAEGSSNIEADISIIRRGKHRVWCNPPYSNIETFVRLALYSKNLWVFLLPSRTGNDWYPMLRWEEKRGRVDIRDMRKRIQFLLNGLPPLDATTGKPQGPRFDSIVAIVRPLA